MSDAPDGMFFNVAARPFGLIAVQLRQPRKSIGSRLISESYIYPGEFESGDAAVEFGKQRAVARWQDAERSMKNYRDALEAGA